MKQYQKVIVLILCVFIFAGSAAGQAPRRMLVLPFQIHAKEDLSFLKKGIADMLSSRLAQPGRLVLSDPAGALKDRPEPANAAEALALGAELGVDYMVFGSITLFGDSVSTDARLIDIKRGQPVVTFNQFGKSQDDAIAHVNQFAVKINEEVFGRKAAAGPSSQQQSAADDSRRHPETLFRESDALGGSGEYSFQRPGERSAVDFSIWRSQRFDVHIRSMAVGDVDGDQKNETVLISENALIVLRYDDGRFFKLFETKGSLYESFISVDVADTNANGKAEIFVTAVETNQSNSANFMVPALRSFVLEWSGKDYERIAEKQPWYFRVINVPDMGDILLGQRRGIEKNFSKGIYTLALENQSYESTGRMPLPRDINIFGFALGDVLNNAQEMIVAFDHNDYLRILSHDGDLEWKSEKAKGGNAVFLKYPMPNSSSREAPMAGIMEMENEFLPQRVHLVDIDMDGKNEVIVVNNRDVMGNLFDKLRVYKSGHVECLFWDAVGLYPKWRTRIISGYVSDCAVVDFDNDGQIELVFSVDTNVDPLIKSKPKSYLVTWKPAEKAPQKK